MLKKAVRTETEFTNNSIFSLSLLQVKPKNPTLKTPQMKLFKKKKIQISQYNWPLNCTGPLVCGFFFPNKYLHCFWCRVGSLWIWRVNCMMPFYAVEGWDLWNLLFAERPATNPQDTEKQLHFGRNELDTHFQLNGAGIHNACIVQRSTVIMLMLHVTGMPMLRCENNLPFLWQTYLPFLGDSALHVLEFYELYKYVF